MTATWDGRSSPRTTAGRRSRREPRGAAAAPDHVYVVRNRKELIAALNDGIYPPLSSSPSNAPKIIYVDRTIDANVDDDDVPLACEQYYRNGFTLEAFLATYDPAVWGR